MTGQRMASPASIERTPTQQRPSCTAPRLGQQRRPWRHGRRSKVTSHVGRTRVTVSREAVPLPNHSIQRIKAHRGRGAHRGDRLTNGDQAASVGTLRRAAKSSSLATRANEESGAVQAWNGSLRRRFWTPDRVRPAACMG